MLLSNQPAVVNRPGGSRAECTRTKANIFERCCSPVSIGASLAMQSQVLVYRGEGAGWRSVRSTCESVERLLSGPLRQCIRPLKVDTISTSQLLDGSWVQHAALLVMPGGADLPYCKHLNGRGNSIIKDFVQSGGAYLGLCAGAYYATARVVFEPGTPMEVVGDRELAFFPGIGRGCAFPGFDYLTEAGAVAAQLKFQVPHALSDLPQQQQTLQQAHGQQGPVMHTVLSGAVQSQLEQRSSGTAGLQDGLVTTLDYCNGGPYLTALDGSPDVDQLPGVTVLAHYCQVPVAAAGPDQQQHQEYARRVAAVRCSVGRGVAVLCGTHPELGPEWLDPCGESNAVQGPQAHEAAAAGVGAAILLPQGAAASILQQHGQHDLQQQRAGGSTLQMLVQDAVGSALATETNSNRSSGGGAADMMPVVCRDIALAAHAQQLRRQLEASQAGRDLLLCSLLYEALAQCRTSPSQ